MDKNDSRRNPDRRKSDVPAALLGGFLRSDRRTGRERRSSPPVPRTR